MMRSERLTKRAIGRSVSVDVNSLNVCDIPNRV